MGIYFRDRHVYKIGLLLSMTCRHCSVQWASDVSGHDHFGTRHFGTYSIRYIVTSGHVISGQARFGTAQLLYFKLLCTGSSHGKSVQAPIWL